MFVFCLFTDRFEVCLGFIQPCNFLSGHNKLVLKILPPRPDFSIYPCTSIQSLQKCQPFLAIEAPFLDLLEMLYQYKIR